MIKYANQSAGIRHFCQKILQRKGSVFPQSIRVAAPNALVTTFITILIHNAEYFDFLHPANESILVRDAAFSGFSFLVGFLVVFRTSQSYARFWDGCTSTHQMRAEWFDGCSSLIAFCKYSKAEASLIADFKNKLVRLFSMLHACALADIEDSNKADHYEVAAYDFELLDVTGIDDTSLQVLRDSAAKVELVFQWIQQLIVESISTGVLAIPPPILSRSFQEIANGMVMFHDAMKIAYIMFPFPYAQTCDFLLLIHWLFTPFVMSQWVSRPWWAGIFSFVQVFVLWTLNFIAVELENPFGSDENDLDARMMQEELNEHLLLLMMPSSHQVPELVAKTLDLTSPENWTELGELNVELPEHSFNDIWGKAQARRFTCANQRGIRQSGTPGSPGLNSASLSVKSAGLKSAGLRSGVMQKQTSSGTSGIASASFALQSDTMMHQGSLLKSPIPENLPLSAPSTPTSMNGTLSALSDKISVPEPHPKPEKQKQAMETPKEPSTCDAQLLGKESTRVFDERLAELTSRMVEYLAQICKDIECVQVVCRQFDFPSISGQSPNMYDSLATTAVHCSTGLVSSNARAGVDGGSNSVCSLQDVGWKPPNPPSLETLSSNVGCPAGGEHGGQEGSIVAKEIDINIPHAMHLKLRSKHELSQRTRC